MPDDSPLATDLPDEEALVVEDIGPHWEMYFDGASQRAPGEGRSAPKIRAGTGIVFLTQKNGTLYHSFFSLIKANNEAEYEGSPDNGIDNSS